MPEKRFSLGVTILAAGFSSRMGRAKLLLPWGGTTIVGHLISQWSQLGAGQIAVVHQENDLAIADELARLDFPSSDHIVNPEPDRGMFSSIQCAAKWNGWQRSLTHFAVALGDQPHLGIATLEAFLKSARQHPGKICQPSHRGHARHPVLFPKEIFQKLARAREQNLKEFLATHSGDVKLLELDDPALDLDIDDPEDYVKALKLFKKNKRDAT